MVQNSMNNGSASPKMHAFTFNGNTGEFVRDFSPETSGSLPKVISPFQILRVKRQYLLEDTKKSSTPGGSRGNGIYRSGYLDVKHQGRFRLYNHKGETYETPAGNDSFNESEITKITKWSDLSKDLRLNKKVVVFGVMNGKLGKITSSEGNLDEVLRFVKSSTSGRIDPFVKISSEQRSLSNGKTYFALKIALFDTAKTPPSAKSTADAFFAIESYVEDYNATIGDPAAQDLEALAEFEERMRTYVGKAPETAPEKILVPSEPETQVSENIVQERIIEKSFDLIVTEDGFDFSEPKIEGRDEEFYSAPDVSDEILGG